MKQFSIISVFSGLFIASFLAAHDSSGGEGASSGGSSGTRGGGVGIVVGENYVLKPSDVIAVDVYQEADLNKSVRIEGDGSVALALVGKVKIAGMTVAESQSLITDLYNRDYLVDPQISVLVVEFSQNYVYILGSVNSPGTVPMPPDRDLTLKEAMAFVRGVSRLGNPKSITIKRVEEDGRARQMEVNFSRIIQDPNAKDIILQQGDTIWVPERII
jgi:polysaccharide export outer membrane protein